MIAYKKEGLNLVTKYSLEYIDNKQDFDYIESGSIANGEPWNITRKEHTII
jgi:hypothetical protein